MSAAGPPTPLLFFALATPSGAGEPQWERLAPVNDRPFVLGAALWIIASVLLVVLSSAFALVPS